MERRIGILLGIDDPHKNVGQRHEAVDLQSVRSRHRVVVGNVEQDQPGELVLIRSVQEGLAAYATFTADAQEVQKGTRIVAPGAGRGLRRGGAAGTDIGELQLGQSVEQRGLARAGTAEQGHNGVINAQCETLTNLLERLPRRNRQGGGHLCGARVECGSQPGQAGLEVDGIERLGMHDEWFLSHADAPGRVKGVSSPARRRRAAAKEGAGASARAAPAGTMVASSAVRV